jgi:DNA-nicking Smr family endonuclease
MTKHKKPSEKIKEDEELEEDRELFLNAYYQQDFSTKDKYHRSKSAKKLSSQATKEDERALFVAALKESLIYSKDRPASEKKPRAKPRDFIDGKIDLHGLFVEDAVIKLFRFLDKEKNRGSRTVLIVHGIGSGALKKAVLACLDSHPVVDDFQVASSRLGGQGAMIVRIRRQAHK